MPLRFSFRETPMNLNNFDDADPDVVGQELMRITDAQKGYLKPEHVLEKAKSNRNPLHKHFEWSDKIAGHKYRLSQARCLIRCLNIIDDEDDEEERRGFVSITDDDHGKSYRKVSDILRDSDLQYKVLQEAERDLRNWMHRYEELADICDLVREAREKLTERLKQRRPKPEPEDDDDRPHA